MDPRLIIFIFATLMMTVSLIWGMKTIISVLTRDRSDNSPLIEGVMSEKLASQALNDDGIVESKIGEIGSFSRVAGAFGMMGLSSVVIGIGYWLLYALFYDKPLEVLQTTGWFFLSGSSLFAPYAFNQLSSIFKLGN